MWWGKKPKGIVNVGIKEIKKKEITENKDRSEKYLRGFN